MFLGIVLVFWEGITYFIFYSGKSKKVEQKDVSNVNETKDKTL